MAVAAWGQLYIGTSAPSEDPVQVGSVWTDTTANLFKRCTAVSPYTWVSTEGGSASHALDSASHTDVAAITEAKGDILVWDGTQWTKLAVGADGQQLEADAAQATGLRWAAAGGGNEFSDDVFRINDDVDGTKKIAFQASGIATATTRTITQPDQNVDLTPNTGTFAAAAHAARHADGGADELAVQDLASDAAADGQVAKADGAGGVAFEDDEAGINFIIDGGGSAITAGEKGHVEVPFACTIRAVRLLADQTGSIKVDIWKDTYANFPPTDVDSITGANEPEIVSGVKDEDTTLTGWTTSIAKGDILAFNVDTVATVQRVTVSLSVKKT